MEIGTVEELWRFPVKSMGGERLPTAQVGDRGLHGDRLWAVRDEELGVITHAKRLPMLLMCAARFVREPPPDVGPDSVPPVVVTLPDGTTVTSDDAAVHARLSAVVGRRVTLQALRPASDRAHYRAAKATADGMRGEFAIEPGQPLPDFSMMPLGKLLELGRYATPPGTYFDAATLHVITTASLAALRDLADADFDRRRFRANLVVATPGAAALLEATWSGGRLVAGGCTAAIECPTPRCSMPTRAQPELPAAPVVMRTIAAHAQRCVGAYATVVTSGPVAVGAPVTFEPARTSRVGAWGRARATGLKRRLLRAAMPK
ncbi:MAG: MOSC N-terminal beta barrel domain-containing protein [Myxococcales bacterium]|nr:MOSC N-terminal beta barrel domain-containing protein [Myxococcales bacterium]